MCMRFCGCNAIVACCHRNRAAVDELVLEVLETGLWGPNWACNYPRTPLRHGEAPHGVSRPQKTGV